MASNETLGETARVSLPAKNNGWVAIKRNAAGDRDMAACSFNNDRSVDRFLLLQLLQARPRRDVRVLRRARHGAGALFSALVFCLSLFGAEGADKPRVPDLAPRRYCLNPPDEEGLVDSRAEGPTFSLRLSPCDLARKKPAPSYPERIEIF